MRKFVDLHLYLKEGVDQSKEILSKAAELGYHFVGVAPPPNAKQEEIQYLWNLSKAEGLDLITRVDLTPKKPKELLLDLRRLRRRFEVICVHCTSKAIARQAAKDRRVDLLSFSPTDPRRRFFDSAEAELASKSLAALEIDMAPLLILTGFKRIYLLSHLKREVFIAKKFGVPIVLSSGASENYLMRNPRDYAALTYLFGMNQESALCSISDEPLRIIERNRKKLSANYVAPGVYIVRRKGDCYDV